MFLCENLYGCHLVLSGPRAAIGRTNNERSGELLHYWTDRAQVMLGRVVLFRVFCQGATSIITTHIALRWRPSPMIKSIVGHFIVH